MFRLLAALLTIGTSAVAQSGQDGSINLLPRYGGVTKSRALRKADERFLAFCDSHFASRQAAATYHAKRGWDCFYADDWTTAIKRFNQAWLLDSTNAAAYWGFGVIEGQRQHNTDALRYFQLSLRHGNANNRLFIEIAQVFINQYQLTHLPANLDSTVFWSQRYLSGSSSNDTTGKVVAYRHLATVNYFKHDYPSAWKYVDQAKALKPKDVQNWDILTALQKASP